MVCHYRLGFGCVFGENAQSCFLVDFQGEEVERVSCDQMRLCLNNKNGTHGEFRCNWQRSAVGWWVEDPPRTASRSATSQRRREGPYGPAFASHPPTLCAAANVGGRARKEMRKRDRDVDSFVIDCLFSTWHLAKSSAHKYELYRRNSKTFPAFGAWVAFSNCVSTIRMSKSCKVLFHCNQTLHRLESADWLVGVCYYLHCLKCQHYNLGGSMTKVL